MMEKYGVSDIEQLQRSELTSVRDRLRILRESTEKTAAETTELEQLENRRAELEMALSKQSSKA